jgi:hypothetical protein
LVCDQTPNTDQAHNYGLTALPNLEHHFVIGNTLIGVNAPKEITSDLGVSNDYFKQVREELAAIREKSYRPKNWTEKKKLRDQEHQKREELARLLAQAWSGGAATGGARGKTRQPTVDVIAEAQKIADYDPYNATKRGEWFDAEWMLDVVGGFDVMIGNPPYFVIDSNVPQKAEYEKHYAHLKSGRMNIYQLFLGRGTSLLSANGVCAFIHPKTLLGDAYLAATREYLLKEYPSFTLVNIVSRTDTFGAVLQSVIISLWEKDQTKSTCRMAEITKKSDFITLF